MLKLLYGAIKPTEGKLVVGTTDVGQLSRATLPKLRRNIGIVFQDFKLIARRNVAENIGLALEVIGADRYTIRNRVSSVLSIVGLQGREHLYPQYLSGGEQQRVAIARAIINDPTILLADEPTGNLDGAMAVEVMEILQAIQLRGTTVMVATHDAAMMQRFQYRVLYLKNGRLIRS
jgi:cell division transport system ATP-binding protein